MEPLVAGAYPSSMVSTEPQAAPSAQVQPPAEGPEPGGRRVPWSWLLLWLLVFAISWGTLADPLISEDSAILGYVHREGAWADWNQSHYGLVTVRFWRPMVTTVWALQEAWGGVEPAFLRAANLLFHGSACALVLALARLLGASAAGAWACALWASFFPYQGGVVTWPAGRTDSLAALGVLAALLAALRGYRALAVVLAFLGCACKESAFISPLWCLLLAWGQGSTLRKGVGTALPVALGAGAAFLWRRIAVGAWVGGYPDLGLHWPSALPRVLWTWFQANQLTLPFLGACVFLAALAGTLKGRLVWAALASAILAAVPLFPLLADGLIESQNLRILYLSDLALGLIAAGCLAGRVRPSLRLIPLFLILSLGLAWRAYEARRDIGDWSAAARGAGEEIEEARRKAAGFPASQVPLFSPDFSRSIRGAYALSFGIADRFREPFPGDTRPVWPLRTVFAQPGAERPLLMQQAGGLFLPRDEAFPGPASRLRITGLDGQPVEELVVDESAAHDPDRSPRVVIEVPYPGARIELLLFTEMGYEAAPWREVGDDATLELSVRELFLVANPVVSLGEVWIQTADLGARRAYLEVRVLEDGVPVAASDWIALLWDEDVLDILR